jgi:hypothetical protein
MPLPGLVNSNSLRLSLDGFRFSLDEDLAGAGPSRDLLDCGLLGTSSSIDGMDLASILGEFNPPEAFLTHTTPAVAESEAPARGQASAINTHLSVKLPPATNMEPYGRQLQQQQQQQLLLLPLYQSVPGQGQPKWLSPASYAIPPAAGYGASAAAVEGNRQRSAVFVQQAHMSCTLAPCHVNLTPSCWSVAEATMMPAACCSAAPRGKLQQVPGAAASSTQVAAAEGVAAHQVYQQQVSRQKPNTKVASLTPQGAWSDVKPGHYHARLGEPPGLLTSLRPRSPSLEGPEKAFGPSFASTAAEATIPFRRSFTELLTADTSMSGDGCHGPVSTAVAGSTDAAMITHATAYHPYPPLYQHVVGPFAGGVDKVPPRIAAVHGVHACAASDPGSSSNSSSNGRPKRAAAERGRIQVRRYAVEHSMSQDENGFPFEEYAAVSAAGGSSLHEYTAAVGRTNGEQDEACSAGQSREAGSGTGWEMAAMPNQVPPAAAPLQLHVDSPTTGANHQEADQAHQQELLDPAAAASGAAGGSDDESWLLENADASSDYDTGDRDSQPGVFLSDRQPGGVPEGPAAAAAAHHASSYC